MSELINLKITDIDSDRMIVSIRQAKGKKDRNVMLPDNLLKLLRTSFLEYNPKIYQVANTTISRVKSPLDLL